jgi:lipopolysaccharide transport protein LptA
MFFASLIMAAAIPAASVQSDSTPGAAPVVVVAGKGSEKNSKAASAAPRNVKVTSERSTYLRKEGVLVFDGNVFVDDVEFKMHADEVTLFLGGTNELKRIVAIGNVAVTNELRSGTCAKATYNKALSRVILYGDEANGITAKLNDNGKRKSQVEGRKITFWIDTEQVEVDGSVITVDVGNGDMKDSAKRFLGN